MKVLLIVRWPVGGIRTYINYIYSQWSDKNIELHFVVPDIPEVDTLSNQLTGLKCQWHRTPSYYPSFIEFLTFTNKVISLNSFDLVHAHGFTSALAFGWRQVIKRIPAIFTSHDVINSTQLKGITGYAKKAFLSLSANRFDLIHSVSQSAQRNLTSHIPLIDLDKCIVIENGIDSIRFFNSEKVDLKQLIKINDDQELIGFFGRFMSQKGFKYLIEAVYELNKEAPSTYHVVCFGSGSYIESEKKHVEEKGLSQLFHFYDVVPDIAPYIKGCDVVAMPSLWEACGLLAMETLTSGVPLVAGNCSGLAEVCEGSPAVMVDPKDINDLKQGIKDALSIDSKVLNDFSIIAKDKFNIEKTRKQLEHIYHSLVQP